MQIPPQLSSLQSYLPTLEKAMERFPLKTTPDTLLTEGLALMSQVNRSSQEDSTSERTLIASQKEEASVPVFPLSSYILVVEDSLLLGILTERDVVRLVAEGRNLEEVTIAEVMTRQVVTITLRNSQDSQTIFSALQLMRQHRIRHLPILDEKKQLLGIVTQTSLSRVLQPSNLLKLRQVGEVMVTQVIQAPLQDSVLSLAQLMSRQKVSCVVIVSPTASESPSPAPVGIITERDIVQFQRLGLPLEQTPAQSVMSTPLVGVSPTDSLWKVQQEMQRLRVRRLVVTGSQGELRGLITQTSLLNSIDPLVLYRTLDFLGQLVAEQTAKVKQTNQELRHSLAARQKIEALLQESEARYRLAFEESAIGMALSDCEGRWLKVNRTLCAILGQSEAALQGKTSQDIIDAQGIVRTSNGKEYAINEPGTPICNTKGRITGTVLVFRDITQSQKLKRQLSWQATHDSLTGLLNRRAFEQKLREAIASVREENQQHVLAYLDLDQFKIVNDTCGHLGGDSLLRQVTALLQTRFRSTDLLARLGGDEFGLLLYQCSLEKASEIVETFRKLIQEYRFSWGGKTFTITASLGLVALDAHFQELNSLLGAADAACYAAKGKGRNCIQVYRPDDRELAEQRGERHWIGELNQALSENRFRLYSQKIVPLLPQSGKELYEVLLRLVSSTGELVSPMAFIPAAERYDLMPTIDRWVISTFFDRYYHHPQADLTGADSQRGLYTRLMQISLEA